jgi:Tol biopolymer transport system component
LAVTRSSGGEAGELWLVPLDGKPPRRLSNDPPGIFSHWPSFTPDGKGIIHVSNRAGASNLWILPLDGGRPARLTSGAGPDDTPSVARDGSIVFINSRARSSLTLYNLADGQTREILNHSWYIWSPVFSPSRRELAFSRAEQDGSWHIWIAPLDGGAPRQLTSGALPEIYPRFTPDGESILYFTWSSGPDRIWSVPRMGGLPTALTPARDDDDQYADISPDGKWLAFGRTENKITRIYVAPLKGGDARRLTETPSTLPRWSPDGRWIAFSPARGYVDGIFLIRPDGTGMRRISGVGGWPVWWPDSKQLAFQNLGDDGSDEYRSVHLATGAIKKLTSLRFTESNHPFDISPDGSTIATVKSVVLLSDIWLLEPR